MRSFSNTMRLGARLEMQVIPLQPLPNQTVQVQLSNQAVQLNLFQNAYGFFMDVLLAGSPVIEGQPCQNLNLIVRWQYLGFVGDFAWLDVQGSEDPVFNQLGTRFILLYLDETDIEALDLPPGES